MSDESTLSPKTTWALLTGRGLPIPLRLCLPFLYLIALVINLLIFSPILILVLVELALVLILGGVLGVLLAFVYLHILSSIFG